MSLEENCEVGRIRLISAEGKIFQIDHTDFGKCIPRVVAEVCYIEVEFFEIALVEEAKCPRQEEM